MQDDAPPPRKPTEVKRPAAGATGDVRSEDSLVGMQIGDTRLVGRIGEGGMGLVYEGWQEPPGRQVAAKLLRDAVATEEARIRFEHEARVLASLRHPAIAQVYRAGTHRDGREFPYFLMEFVPGARTLADYTRHEKLTLEATLKLASRVCRGVQAGASRPGTPRASSIAT
ncbi:MAG: protein kinase [Planctomycetota bacterium]|nr:protein kinase [Planctomycetota bacterium]